MKKRVLIVNDNIADLINKIRYLKKSDIKDNEGILVMEEEIIELIKNIIEKESKEKLIELLKGVKDEEKKITKEFIF